MKPEDWHKVKWSLLSRLDADAPLLTRPHMPFLVTTYGSPETGNLDASLHLSSLDKQQQEIKALSNNEAHSPSDTDAIAIQEGRNQDRMRGIYPSTYEPPESASKL